MTHLVAKSFFSLNSAISTNTQCGRYEYGLDEDNKKEEGGKEGGETSTDEEQPSMSITRCNRN